MFRHLFAMVIALYLPFNAVWAKSAAPLVDHVVAEFGAPIEMEVWLTAHSELHQNPSVRAVYDFLSHCFATKKVPSPV